MKGRLGKTTAIALVCYCRQAERSVDRVLTAPRQWSSFVAYYDEHKRAAIMELIAQLSRAGSEHAENLSRDDFAENVFIGAIWSLVGPLLNKAKRYWSFTEKELSFFRSTLETLLRILQLPEIPKNQELVQVRMDLYVCQWIIDRRMLGVRELRDVARIEHFNQPEFLEHVTLRQMGVAPIEISA